MKQTAIEWLENEFQEMCKDFGGIHSDFIVKFEQAKEMEKEQIMDAANSENSVDINYGERYYNETFKSENIVMFMTPENGEIESIILTDNPFCGVKGITFKSE